MPASILILLDEPIAPINPHLHGHFAEHLGTCISDGLWVGPDSLIPNIGGLRTDVVEALRRLRVPVLRWPGGCFADDYHWRDGVGPRHQRPRTVNLWWGQCVEDNGFGTHEFLNLCRLIGAEPYLAGNLGSAPPSELRDWVEYCNYDKDSTLAKLRAANGSPTPFGVRYWGVGNEAWGCGGNLCPEDYAAHYKRYATFCRDLGGTPLYLIACGPDGARTADFHLDWTRRFFNKLGSFDRIHGFAAHYYCGTAGNATEYDVNQWYELIDRATRVERLIVSHRAAMDEFDPQRRIGLVLDEWGTWHPPTQGCSTLWQQNTIRDALVAAVSLNAFHRQADKLVMANLSQVVNVLQSVCLTRGDRMVLTPTYHIFEMYQPHQGATTVRTIVESPTMTFAANNESRRKPALDASASTRAGHVTISVANVHAQLPVDATIAFRAGTPNGEAKVTTLVADDITAHNTFDEPDAVRPTHSTITTSSQTLRHTFPPASVTTIRARMM
ncbi:MAG: alpha-N-arabinofuranosidase [Tepidisphaeraceae bacterium]